VACRQRLGRLLLGVGRIGAQHDRRQQQQQHGGRGGATGGTVTLKASRDVALNNSVVTNNGGIGVTATTGAATMANGTALVSGTAPIAITAGGNVTTGGVSGGSLAATSTGGSVAVGGLIDGTTGRVDLVAANDVAINAPVLNTRNGSSLNATAGQNIIVNAQIDGQDDGTVSATTDSYIQEVHYDEGAKYETEWGCSNCGHEAHVLEKLVKVADEEIDEALQRERNPIPGQLRIEVGQ